MIRRQEYDRARFIAAAKRHGAEISVVTDARVIPRVQGNAVVMKPVILLHYVLKFEDNGREQQWVFEETIDENDGRLDIAGSLYSEIQNDKELRLRVLDPTMALSAVQ